MERSVYIIKPEGMSWRSQIHGRIAAADLEVVSKATVELQEWVLAALYADLAQEQNELWHATLDHMLGKWCEVGIVSGNGAVEKLLRLCGEKTNPHDCGPQTLRYLYGTKVPIIAGEKFYWPNAVHRSKSTDEAATDLTMVARLSAPVSRD